MKGYKVQKFGSSCESCKLFNEIIPNNTYDKITFACFYKNKYGHVVDKNGICNNYKSRVKYYKKITVGACACGFHATLYSGKCAKCCNEETE